MPLSRAELKSLRALRTTKGRRDQGAFLIEGEKLVREAIAAGATVRRLLATRARIEAMTALSPERPPELISPPDAQRLADTRAPQGCFAVLEDSLQDATDAVAALPSQGSLTVLALDGVQDPGNVGALIRVAAAFGADLVLCGPGTADPAQPKVLRAATGAWFHVALASTTNLAAALTTLHDGGCAILGADPRGRSVYTLAGPPARWALVVGNEGAGFSNPVAARIDTPVGVPLAAGVESLNVAVAAGIIVAELARRAG